MREEVLSISFRCDVKAKLEPKALFFSKDLLMQYKILQTHFFACIAESFTDFCVLCYSLLLTVLLGHYKYSD